MNELIPVVRSVSITPDDWSCLKDQAKMFIASGALQKNIQKPEQAMVIMMRGRELGLPPMTSLSSIHFFDGNTILSSDLMKALVYRDCPGAKIYPILKTDKKAVVKAERPGEPATEYEYTIEMASKWGALNKTNWKNHPLVMLLHRATAIACRDKFPDVVHGCYIPDEEEEMRDVTPKSVTPEESKAALAEIASEKDYLPRIEPKQTAKQFVDGLKDIPGGDKIIQDQIITYRSQGDQGSAEKLENAVLGADPDGKFPFEK